ncbi:MAG: 16S rRNA (guanine(527)-N(7))-methyltransferase RsmG [Thermomicrobiales bacterium]
MSGASSLVSSVAADAEAIGVMLTNQQQDQLANYRDLLLTWNTRFNLTAIREPKQVEQRLFLDALRMLPEIERRLAGGAPAPSVADVGTGAGFPGMVFAIVHPDWPITLIEATAKKVRFLEHVATELELGQATPVHARAEDLGHDQAYRGAFDVAVARAVASLPALLELCAPLLRRGGHALFPKSSDIADELADGRRVAPMVGMRLNGDGQLPASTTRLITAVKVDATPSHYPRRAGIPAREPLRGAVPAKLLAQGGTR